MKIQMKIKIKITRGRATASRPLWEVAVDVLRDVAVRCGMGVGVDAGTGAGVGVGVGEGVGAACSV